MGDSWQDSVVLIESNDTDDDNYGTGFIIHKDEQATYLLTCTHVVQNVGGPEKIQINKAQARVIASSPVEDADLAILRLEKQLSSRPLPLCVTSEKGRPFSTAGFHLEGKRLVIREIHGTLGNQVGLLMGTQDGRIKAWDLEITDKYLLQAGYSGSPVVDEHRNVIGVVNTRRGEGKTGTAISIEALENIWRPLPLGLFVQATSYTTNAPFILPRDYYSKFIGREQDLQQLQQLLLNSDIEHTEKIVGIAGMAGIGKSALAINFARASRNYFPDGVIYMRIDHGSADELAQKFVKHSHVGDEIDFNQYSASEIMESYFRQKRMLLILDNAEDASIVRELLPGEGACAVIITSRNNSLLDELLPRENRIDLRGFTEEETQKFLGQFLKTAQVEPHIKALHTLVGGLPLATQIAGAFLQKRQGFISIEQYVVSLRDEKERLTHLEDYSGRRGNSNGESDKDISVRASFHLSWDILKEEEKDLFACLSACTPEGFSKETALKVSGQHQKYANENLFNLYRYNLCMKIQGEYFALHPLLFVFAREQAEKRNLLKIAEKRHTEHFVQLVEKHKGLSATDFEDLSPTDFEALEKELDALVLTGERLAHDVKRAVDFYMLLKPFLQSRGYWSRAYTWVNMLLEAARNQQNTFYEVFCMMQCETYLHHLADYNKAEQFLRESERLVTKVEDAMQRKMLIAMLRAKQGGLYRDQHKQAEAENALKASLDLWQELGKQWERAKVLNKLGALYQSQGKMKEAENDLLEGLAIAENLNDLGLKGKVLNTLGAAYQKSNNLREAERVLNVALVIAEQQGNRKSIAMVKGRLAGVYRDQGRKKEAKDALQENIAILIEMSDNRNLISVLNMLKDIYVSENKTADALDLIGSHFEHIRKAGYKEGEVRLLIKMAELYLHQKNLAEVENVLREALNIARASLDRRVMGEVLKWQGKMYEALKDYAKDTEVLEQSLKFFRDIDDRQEMGVVLSSLGIAYHKQNKKEQAIRCLRECFEIQESEHSKYIGKTTNLLVNLLRHKKELARKYCQRALDIAPDDPDVLKALRRLSPESRKEEDLLKRLQKEEAKNSNERYTTLHQLGSLYVDQGKMQEAEEVLRESLALGREKGNKTHISIVLSTLSELYQKQGKMRKAEEILVEYAEIATEDTEKFHLAITMIGLGNRYKDQGRYEQMRKKYELASPLLREYFAIQEKLGNSQEVVQITHFLVHVLLPLFQKEVAWQYWRRAQALVPDDPILLKAENRLRKFTAAEEPLQADMELSEELDDRVRARVALIAQGEAYLEQGKLPEAEEVLYLSLELGKEQNNQRHIGMVQKMLGEVYQAQGKLQEAEDILRASLVIGEELDDKKHIGIVLNSLGNIYRIQGRMEEAEEVLHHSLTIGETLQDQTHIQLVHHTLGTVYLARQKWQEAEENLQLSLNVATILDDKKHIMLVQKDLSTLYQIQGRILEAEQAQAECSKIEQFLKTRMRVWPITRKMSEIARRPGRWQEAEQVLREVLEDERLSENTIGAAMLLNTLGEMYKEQEKIREAEKTFLESLSIAIKYDDKRLIEITLIALATICEKQKKYEQASRYLQEAFGLLERRKADTIGLATSFLVHVLMNVHRKEITLARQYCQRALAIVPNDPALLKAQQRVFKKAENEEDLRDRLAIYEVQGNMEQKAPALHKLGKIYKSEKRIDEAETLFLESLDIGRKLNLTGHISIVLKSLGEIYAMRGEMQKAEKVLKESYALMAGRNDKVGMAIVQETLGKQLLERGKFEQASMCLQKSFTLYEELQNKQGVTTLYFLVKVLIILHREEEALAYYERAVKLWSEDRAIQTRLRYLERKIFDNIQQRIRKAGYIKRLIPVPNGSNGSFYGFITPDDGSQDIYFKDEVVAKELKGRLRKNTRVYADIQIVKGNVSALRVGKEKEA